MELNTRDKWIEDDRLSIQDEDEMCYCGYDICDNCLGQMDEESEFSV